MTAPLDKTQVGLAAAEVVAGLAIAAADLPLASSFMAGLLINFGFSSLKNYFYHKPQERETFFSNILSTASGYILAFATCATMAEIEGPYEKALVSGGFQLCRSILTTGVKKVSSMRKALGSAAAGFFGGLVGGQAQTNLGAAVGGSIAGAIGGAGVRVVDNYFNGEGSNLKDALKKGTLPAALDGASCGVQSALICQFSSTLKNTVRSAKQQLEELEKSQEEVGRGLARVTATSDQNNLNMEKLQVETQKLKALKVRNQEDVVKDRETLSHLREIVRKLKGNVAELQKSCDREGLSDLSKKLNDFDKKAREFDQSLVLRIPRDQQGIRPRAQ